MRPTLRMLALLQLISGLSKHMSSCSNNGNSLPQVCNPFFIERKLSIEEVFLLHLFGSFMVLLTAAPAFTIYPMQAYIKLSYAYNMSLEAINFGPVKKGKNLKMKILPLNHSRQRFHQQFLQRHLLKLQAVSWTVYNQI